MASVGYDSQLNESMPVIGQGNGINGQTGSMPAIKRRVYSNYDKKAYMQDLHEIIREQMNKGQNANARQNLMIKRNQKVAQDDFKDADRQIKVNRKASTDQPERGMGLLNRNIEKDKLEREAMKQQYRHDIMAQIKEKEGTNSKYRLLDKISYMPPAINSAKRGYPEESQSRPKPQNRHQYEDSDQYGRGPQQQDDYRNDQGNIQDDSYNRQGNQHQYSQEDESYAKKQMSGQQYERVPSANEYYSVSIPDNYQPKQPSAFQRASVSNLGNFNRRQPSASIANKAENNEFFDRNFGSQHDRKKQQQQEMKNQLVNELQIQMELKKERERREKAVKALEDQRAEDRYVKELTVLNDQRQAEAVRPPTNIFAEGLTDAEIISEKRRESEWAASKPISVQELPKDPEYSRHHQAEVSINHKQQQELSLVSRGADRSRAVESLHAMSRDHHATHISQNSVSNIAIGRDLDPLSSAIQQHQQPPSKYSEYNQRVTDYAAERMDDRKRELRMNTNLLYQQLIDLRGEKNYSDNLKQQAFQNYDTVRRNLEKQNRQLNHDINSLIGLENRSGSDLNGNGSGANPRRAFVASSGAGGSEITPSRRDQYHQQGLKMVEDVFDPINIRSNGNILDYRTDVKEGGFTTLDDGEIIMSAETQLIPISYKQVDRMSLDKFAMLNPSEMNELVKKEARQDRITAQISYQSPEERLDDLKRRNLDFDTLMAEMSKECRHIYEDEIGIRPVKRGQGVETLDQIIDNLYNDDFKVKNLPPKSKSTNTEAQKSPAEVFANQEKNVDSPSFFNPEKADSGIYTEKFNMKVKDSPEHLFDSFEGSKLDKMPESKEPNIFSIEDVESPRAQNSNKNLPAGSLSSVASKENNLKKSEQGKEGIKVSSPIDNNKKAEEHKKSPVPQIVINPPKNGDRAGTSLQPEMSFSESSNSKSKIPPLNIDSQKDKPEETKKIKIVLDKDVKNKEPDSDSDAGDRESDEDGQKDSDADDGDEEVEEGGDEGTEEDEELGSEKDGSETPASKRDHSESGNSTPAQGAKKGLLKKGTLGDEQLNRSESKKKVTFSELPE